MGSGTSNGMAGRRRLVGARRVALRTHERRPVARLVGWAGLGWAGLSSSKATGSVALWSTRGGAPALAPALRGRGPRRGPPARNERRLDGTAYGVRRPAALGSTRRSISEDLRQRHVKEGRRQRRCRWSAPAAVCPSISKARTEADGLRSKSCSGSAHHPGSRDMRL